MNLSNTAFVEFLKKMLGQPYWYGTCLYKCSDSLLKTKTKQYPAHYGSSRTATYKKHINKKYVAADCVGLGKGWVWTNGGVGVLESIGNDNTFKRGYAVNGCPDKSANGMFSYAKTSGKKWGPIASIPEVPGLAVRYDGHVGYYIGNGEVIEARGFNYGIVKTKLAGRKWSHWYEFPGINYTGETYPVIKPEEGKLEQITSATVKTEGGRLNLRAEAKDNAAILARIPNGQNLPIYEKQAEWSKTYYNGVYGYVFNTYLVFANSIPTTTDYNLGDRLPLKKGMRGGDVEELQEILLDLDYSLPKYNADGDFGSETEKAVKQFQTDNNLIADGVITQDVLKVLLAIQGETDIPDSDDKEETPNVDNYPTLRKGAANEYVTLVQTWLKKLKYDIGTYGVNKDGIDGEYGTKTVNAIRAFQKSCGIKVDGICGPNTWTMLSKAIA